mmetsp:Transcript_65685/g.140464  ORF Transcript_65685/g.140464 Transcript_65685/m.140464 type:complete len:129 (-) Transcript_65685:26-412(-)
MAPVFRLTVSQSPQVCASASGRCLRLQGALLLLLLLRVAATPTAPRGRGAMPTDAPPLLWEPADLGIPVDIAPSGDDVKAPMLAALDWSWDFAQCLFMDESIWLMISFTLGFGSVRLLAKRLGLTSAE